MSTCGSTSEPSIFDDDGSEQSFPLERELEGLELIQDLMSDENLQRLSGSEDLTTVRSIELSFNSEEVSIRDLGKRLPNLTELKLSNSSVLGIRDLGSGFDRLQVSISPSVPLCATFQSSSDFFFLLQVLWLTRASLRDLDGISAFSVIRELYLSYNDISDVSPFAGCDTLEVLDLEGNDIDDLSSLQFLSSCNLLSSLSLESNPVASQPEYRGTVLSWLPQLQILDDISRGEDISSLPELHIDDGLKPLNTSSPNTSVDVSIVEELELVRQGIKHGRVGLDDSTFVLYSRATTSGGLRGRPSSASLISRPTSASLSRPATAKQRPLSAEMPYQRPSTARPSTAFGSNGSQLNVDAFAEDASSDLTFGGEVFCGNAVGALRKRKGGLAAAEAARNSGSPQKAAIASLSLFEELKKWKVDTANLLINDEVVEPVSSNSKCVVRMQVARGHVTSFTDATWSHNWGIKRKHGSPSS